MRATPPSDEPPSEPGFEELAATLVAQARRKKIALADAKDLAQQAITELLARRPRPDHPRAYARATMKNLIADHFEALRLRETHDASWAEGVTAPPGPTERLLDADALLRADALLEHFITWGEFDREGRTRAVIESVASEDLAPIVERLRYYLAVIDRLPASTRHRRGLRRELLTTLRAALAGEPAPIPAYPRLPPGTREAIHDAAGHSGYATRAEPLPSYMYADFGEEDGEDSLSGWGDDEEESDDGNEVGQGDEEPSGQYMQVRLINPRHSRGAMLACRLRPSLSFDEAIAIAEQAADLD